MKSEIDSGADSNSAVISVNPSITTEYVTASLASFGAKQTSPTLTSLGLGVLYETPKKVASADLLNFYVYADHACGGDLTLKSGSPYVNYYLKTFYYNSHTYVSGGVNVDIPITDLYTVTTSPACDIQTCQAYTDDATMVAHTANNFDNPVTRIQLPISSPP